MKNFFLNFCFLLSLGILAVSCQPQTDYQAYKDIKNKGKQIFSKDLQICKNLVDQSTKRSEGSEGAGERMNREKFIFKSCMKKNDWILKS